MSTDKLKRGLQSIREALKSGNDHAAIEKCQELLQCHPKSYKCWVLLGIAYQSTDTENAILCLRKATEYDRKPTQALEELINCVPVDDIPSIYGELLSFNPKNFLRYHKKLAEIGSSNPRLRPQCIEILKKDEANAETYDRWRSCQCSLAKIWCSQDEVDEADLKLFKTCLETASADRTNQFCRVECYKRYFKLLYDLGEYEKLVVRADTMFNKFPEKICPLEWICKVYCEKYESNPTVLADLPQPIDFYVRKLEKLKANSSVLSVIKAMGESNADQEAPVIESTTSTNQQLTPDKICAASHEADFNLVAQTPEKSSCKANEASYSDESDEAGPSGVKLNDAAYSGSQRNASDQGEVWNAMHKLSRINLHTTGNSNDRDALKLVIKDFGSPNGSYSSEQGKLIENALNQWIITRNQRQQDSTAPRFGRIRYNGGFITLNCKDQASYDFVKNVIPTFQLWNGAALRAVPVIKQRSRMKAYLYVPDLGIKKWDLLNVLKAQNPSLPVDGWTLINENRPSDGYKSYVVLMTDVPEPLRKEKKMRVAFGANQVTLKLIKKHDGCCGGRRHGECCEERDNLSC